MTHNEITVKDIRYRLTETIPKSSDGKLDAIEQKWAIHNRKVLFVTDRHNVDRYNVYVEMGKNMVSSVVSNTFAETPSPAKKVKAKKPKVSKFTPEEQEVIDESRADWNNQCIRFMQGIIPFRDKTAKACYERHKKSRL